MLKVAAYVAIVTSLALTSGCTKLAGGARIEDPNIGTPRQFAGLLPAQSGASPTSNLHYVFVIHGMGATHSDYDQSLLNDIERRGYIWHTKGTYVEVRLPKPVHVSGEALPCDTPTPDAPCTYTTFGKYRVDRFQRNSADGATVVVFTYFWNDALAVLQRYYLGKDYDTNTGAWINTRLKQRLMDDGFGDATAYLGPVGRLVRQGIEGSLCAMVRDAADSQQTPTDRPSDCQFAQLTASQFALAKRADYSFLSFSLGSRMLYDVLSALADEQSIHTEARFKAAVLLAARTRNFFMAANQMPLLGLGRIAFADAGGGEVSSSFALDSRPTQYSRDFFQFTGSLRTHDSAQLKQFNSEINQEDLLAEGLQVIAFHDPADLLGFRATGGIRDAGTTTFVEVNHRNTPVILGLLAWPGSAHATELKHTDSRALILCGGKSNERGVLSAEAC